MKQKVKSDITVEISNMVSRHARAEGIIIKLNTMASEKIKAIEERRKENYKAMAEKDDLENKLKLFCWINDKALKHFESSPVKLASFHIKIKGLNNANNQMQKENALVMELIGQFEILEAKLRNEVMTTQSEKNEISVKVNVFRIKSP